MQLNAWCHADAAFSQCFSPSWGTVTQCRISVFNSIYRAVFENVLHLHFIVHLTLLLLLKTLPPTSTPTLIIIITFKRWVKMLETVYCFECMYFETELKMLETIHCFWVLKCELRKCLYFVCANFRKFIQSLMSSKPLSAVAAVHCCSLLLLFTAVHCCCSLLFTAAVHCRLLLLPVYSNSSR